jgi:predicted HicB family RNase H-like nuclease
MLNPNTVQFSIRVSRETHKKLKREAEKERRTLNAEIVKRIEEGLARNGKKVTA